MTGKGHRYLQSVFQGSCYLLEKEMATHSSVLAWEISWTESLAGHSPWSHRESDATEHAYP